MGRAWPDGSRRTGGRLFEPRSRSLRAKRCHHADPASDRRGMGWYATSSHIFLEFSILIYKIEPSGEKKFFVAKGYK